MTKSFSSLRMTKCFSFWSGRHQSVFGAKELSDSSLLPKSISLFTGIKIEDYADQGPPCNIVLRGFVKCEQY